MQAVQITDPQILTLALAAILLLWQLPGWLRGYRAGRLKLWTSSRLARALSRLMRYYEFDEETFFTTDDAPEEVVAARRRGFFELAAAFSSRGPLTISLSRDLEESVSDALFTDNYRVPFPFRAVIRRNMRLGTFVEETSGPRIKDIDGNWSYDLSGSYGVNLFGYDFYKQCIDRGIDRVRALGPVLGQVHPIVAENATRLRRISRLDEVSFHMSGTEAVMQAVGLARFHTGRRRVAVFAGAYHGWWNGVQARSTVGGTPRDLCVLEEMNHATLDYLDASRDIACVLVNPVQVMHPNRSAPGDAMLLDGSRTAHADRDAYADWLRRLRRMCTHKGIVLILDEVFVGFRLGIGGAQEYFGIRADMVTYGKTLGGGLPIGVVCGKRPLMKRFRDDRPAQFCFARGTFNAHPYVMGAMNEFLRRLETEPVRDQLRQLDSTWDGRAALLNERLAASDLPVRIVNLVSIWTIAYTRPSRYNWMYQYYLRAEGLALSWIGTGRLILPHSLSDEDFGEIAERIVRAATAMRGDGWWWLAPEASHRSVRRQLLRELVLHGLLGLRPKRDREHALASRSRKQAR